MPVIAELEFTVGPLSAPNAGYPMSPRLRINGQDEIFPGDVLKIDLDELANLRAEDSKYEARLTELFFGAPNAKDALQKASAQLDQSGPGNMLRVRLLIEPAAQELHHVRWECLRDTAGNPLFNGDTILFSRFLSSPNLRPIGPKSQLKALIAIANPPNLNQAINPENLQAGLPPVDVKNEKLRAETGLKGAGFAVNTLASPPNGTVAATTDNILRELEKGYDVFYLVCHGGLVQQSGKLTPMLWLEDGEDPVDAARLVEGVRNMAQPPRLVVLASCQSAGADGTAAAASGALGALGPLLAGAGVPAVIAMQGNIKMSTVDRFMPQFLAELAKDGHIDRAMGKARGHVLDCNDYWMPVLFMRLSDGLIWSQTLATQATSAAPEPDPAIKDQARKIFADLSATSAIFPLEQVLDAGAQAGEVAPIDPGVWKLIVPAPDMPAYAMFSAFGAFRVLALGHEHMLSFQNAIGQNYFLDEGLAWLKGSRAASVILSAKPTDALLRYPTNLFSVQAVQSQLATRGYHVEAVQDLSDGSKLSQAGIVVIANSWGDFTPAEMDAITNFLDGGGGFLAAGLGWSWPHSLAKYPMNQLLKDFGAKWTAN